MFGMGPTPPAFTRPFWRDRFFWLFAGTLVFWIVLLRLLFFPLPL
jgi:hypothetical protein